MSKRKAEQLYFSTSQDPVLVLKEDAFDGNDTRNMGSTRTRNTSSIEDDDRNKRPKSDKRITRRRKTYSKTPEQKPERTVATIWQEVITLVSSSIVCIFSAMILNRQR